MSIPVKVPAKPTKPTTPPMDSPEDRKDVRPNFIGSSMMTMQLRDPYDKQTHAFLVHKSQICFYSPYFTAALNGQFEEAEKQEIDLGQINHKAFEVFVNWIYTQRIEVSDGKGFWEAVNCGTWVTDFSSPDSKMRQYNF